MLILFQVIFLKKDFKEFNSMNQRILLPSSQLARPKLAHQLNINNVVIKIDLYKPIPHHQNINEVKQLVKIMN